MIASVRGRVLQRSGTGVVIEVGGLGLRILTTPDVVGQARTGEEAALFTSMIVREDGWQLYGFPDETTRDTFESLQSVSGIGPRIALAAVSTLDTQTIAAAVVNEDHAVLTRIPGIGKKGAARMCIELKDRFTAVIGVPGAVAAAAPSWQADVRDALVGLGWSAVQADGAVDRLAAEEADRDVADALRAALGLLGRR